jgi:hypothetical protein
MTQERVREVLNWEVQKQDFEPDGSLRDIYIRRTTIEDWRAVLALILQGPYQADFRRAQAAVTVPSDVGSLFGTPDFLLRFSVDKVDLACHFFSSDEIEFDFVPNS